MSDTATSGAATSAADLLGADTASDQTQAGAETAAQTQQTQGQQGAQAGAEASWVDGVDDPDLKSWLQNKGYASPKDLATAHRGLESLLGREKLPLPKDENDREGYDRVFKALGRPDDAAGYSLDKIEGADPAFATAAAGKFHELGLSAKQGAGLAAFWQESQAQSIAAAEAAWQNQSKTEMEAWRSEAGAQYDAQVEHARRAIRAYGLDKTAVAAIERGMGTKAFMAFISKVGAQQAEDAFVSGQGKAGFSMGADAAKGRIEMLRGDATWFNAYLNGDADKRAEFERLHKIAYPE